MPREEDFSVSVTREVLVFKEPRTFGALLPREPMRVALTCAREDLQSIANATLIGSLGSKAPNIGYKLETVADFISR